MPAGTGDGGVEIRARMVQPADDDGPRHPEPVALSPERGGRGVDIVGGRDDKQHRVRRTEPGAQLADEIRVARVCPAGSP